MSSSKCLCCNSYNDITVDLSISKHLNSLTKSLEHIHSFQKNSKKIQKQFEIENESIGQSSTKNSTASCINFINEYSIVFTHQKILVEKTLNEIKKYLDEVSIKIYSIERTMRCIDCRGAINFPKIDGLDIYFALNEILELNEDPENVTEFRKKFSSKWPSLFESGIKYGKEYIDKLNHLIDVINEVMISLETNWCDNITTVTSLMELCIERIIFYKEKNQIEEAYVDERIKYTIRKEFIGFKNNVHLTLKTSKAYQKEIVTMKEDIVKIIVEDGCYRAKKIQEKRERNELINKQRQFFSDISDIFNDIEDTTYREENFPDLEAYTKTTSEQTFKEIGDILAKMVMIRSNERKQKSLNTERTEEKFLDSQITTSITISSSDVSEDRNSEE